ncbi:MAG TPA: PH domain-containing protein [Actinoplanes sp.]|nr:PH domain-containing protein [Actinoplanes sp.]
MPFPDGVLTEDEDVVLHLHPHAKAAVRPVLVLALALAVTIVVWVMLPANDGGLIGVAVVGAVSLFLALTRGVWPLLVWRCTHYVFTTERILLQHGVLTRERRDLPLNRVNDHVASQSLMDRMFGCGTLRIDSIGDQAAEMVAVPQVQRVQTTLYELIEADRELHGDEAEADAGDEPPVSGARTGPLRPPRVR